MVGPQRLVLIVEDSADDEILITRALKKVAPGCETVVARNAEQAIDYIRQGDESEHPALMLVDINLPRIGGLELVEQVRREPQGRDLPIIVLTSSGHRLDRQMSQRLGADGYIQKAVQYEEMVRSLESIGPLIRG